MLKHYLSLNLLRLHRRIVDLGGHPVLNYLFILFGFLLLSLVLFMEYDYFSYTYMLIALYVAGIWSNPVHNDFLKLTYPQRVYYRIRLAENVMTVMPFVIFLALADNALNALILLVLSALLVLVRYKVTWQIVFPTPFSKHPFEFIIGFRLAFWLFLGAYYLTYVAIKHANFGIGVFAILAVSLVSTLFYVRVEDLFFVWIFSCKAKKFLHNKLKIAVMSTFFLSLPILAALAVFYPDKLLTILLFQFAGLCYVCAGVLCKYSTFPGEIGVREGMLLMFSVIFPPLLLFTIPYLHNKAKISLEGVLG